MALASPHRAGATLVPIECRSTTPDLLGDVESASRRRLERLGLCVETLAIEGRAFETILGTDVDRGIDAIAVGTHGRTGFRHVPLGGGAEKMARRARCPVLKTLRHEIASQPRPIHRPT